jgi:hypothetical protein
MGLLYLLLSFTFYSPLPFILLSVAATLMVRCPGQLNTCSVTDGPVVTYGSESWPLSMEEERALVIFERKILRKIYGPVKENELRRIRRNDELEAIINGENIVRFIKCQTIRWLGHIERMQDTAISKKMYGKLYATRRRGRPKMR